MADPIEIKPSKPPESAESDANSVDNESSASLSVFRSPIAPKSEGEQRNQSVNAGIINREVDIDAPVQRPLLKNDDKSEIVARSTSFSSTKPDAVTNVPGNRPVPLNSAEKPVDVIPSGKPVHALGTPSASERLTPQEIAPAKATVPSAGDVQSRSNQPTNMQNADAVQQTPARSAVGDAKQIDARLPVAEATGSIKTVGVQSIESQSSQFRNAGTNSGDRPQPAAVVSPDRKSDIPIVPQNAVQRINETSPAPVLNKAAVDAPGSNLANPGTRQAEKPVTGEVATALPGSQNKGELTRIDQINTAPVKFDPARGSDVFSTQGAASPAVKQDVARGGEAKFESGKPVEQTGVKDTVAGRDPKSAGVMNEIMGQKAETAPRLEPSTTQLGANKQDTISAGQKADQITKGIEGRVNEGAKQPSVAEGRVPGTSETTTAAGKQPGTTDGATAGVRQPGIESGGKTQGIADGAQAGVKQTGATDGASVTGKQPNVSEGASSSVRQPLHEGGDKAPSSGSGGSGTAESTRKIDAGMGAGSKAEGQSATGGMGGGSSAPTDRAPHKPFSVEDAQPTKGTTGDVRGDLTGARSGEGAGGKVGDAVGGKGGEIAGAKGGEAAGGKAGDVVGGKAGDIAGSKGTATGGAGPRFDTGEVRGTEPGARFDSGELKDGRSAGSQSGGLKGGEGSAVKGSDAGIVKGTDLTGTKGATGGGQGIGGSSGSSGSADSGLLGDKRQPSMLPDGMLNQGGKPGKVGDGVSGGGGIFGTDVPFVLPGALAGKEGGRRQADQIFTDKGKADVAPVGKQDAVAAAGKSDTSAQTGRSDFGGPVGKGDSGGPAGKGESGGPGGRGEPSGKGDPVGPSGKGDPVSPSGKGEAGGAAGKGEQSKDFRDKGQKADVGIPAAMAGQIGAGAAEVGGVLKNFAQSVLSDGKSSGQTGEAAQISKDLKDAFKSPAAMDGSGKETPNVRHDFAGPGRKTQILPNDATAGASAVGPGGVAFDAAAKKSELGTVGSAIPGLGADGTAADRFSDDAEGGVPLEEFNLPEVDLLSDADEVEEIEEIEESVEAKIEDEMHYELALGLQLYTSIAGAQYGAYHYHTKDGDTVESVSRDIVGDVRCSPLVFSLNKEHIVASTEYGVHPFKVGVMVQLPTPRDLKEFFGEQA